MERNKCVSFRILQEYDNLSYEFVLYVAVPTYTVGLQLWTTLTRFRDFSLPGIRSSDSESSHWELRKVLIPPNPDPLPIKAGTLPVPFRRL